MKISNFGFIFKDLVANKHISSKLFFRDVVEKLDEEKDGVINLNNFISWIESVRVGIFITSTYFCSTLKDIYDGE